MPEKQKPPYRDLGKEAASHIDASEQKIIEAFIAGDMQAFKYVYNKSVSYTHLTLPTNREV